VTSSLSPRGGLQCTASRVADITISDTPPPTSVFTPNRHSGPDHRCHRGPSPQPSPDVPPTVARVLPSPARPASQRPPCPAVCPFWVHLPAADPQVVGAYRSDSRASPNTGAVTRRRRVYRQASASPITIRAHLNVKSSASASPQVARPAEMSWNNRLAVSHPPPLWFKSLT